MFGNRSDHETIEIKKNKQSQFNCVGFFLLKKKTKKETRRHNNRAKKDKF